MTGNLQRQGGGFGEMRGDDGYTVNLPSLPDEWDKQEKQPILISPLQDLFHWNGL